MSDSGMSPLVRCTCSAWGRTCSAAKRWNVAATREKSSSRWPVPGPLGERRQERRVAAGREERRAPAQPVRRDAEAALSPERPRAGVGDRVGDEGAREVGLARPVRAVAQRRPLRPRCPPPGGRARRRGSGSRRRRRARRASPSRRRRRLARAPTAAAAPLSRRLVGHGQKPKPWGAGPRWPRPVGSAP